MQLPDYQGRNLVNLMASLQNGLGGPTHAYRELDLLPAKQAGAQRQVLLWVIDGLGFNFLRAHPQAVHLNAHLRGSMTSVYPPTTASAITTLLTGAAPQQHGLTGWYMYFRELGSILTVLPGKARYGGVGLAAAGIDMAALLGHVAFADRIGVSACIISPASIAHSDFNRAHIGRARLASYSGLSGLLAVIRAELRAGDRKFVYAYWPELDSIGHREGIGSESARTHLLELDQAFMTLLEQVRGTDTLVIVCADHGQVDTTPATRLCLDDHPELRDMLAMPLCGEPRSVFCYLRPGCEDRFDAYVASALAGIVRAFPASRLIDDNWFGLGEPHPELLRRIGDRVLLLQSNYTLKDWLPQEKRFAMVGAHGGLSSDELLVPLIIARA
jgi:Type I phosphodiesterase / nucleotide pyrophosphatase